jgi:hypothetical protein
LGHRARSLTPLRKVVTSLDLRLASKIARAFGKLIEEVFIHEDI